MKSIIINVVGVIIGLCMLFVAFVFGQITQQTAMLSQLSQFGLVLRAHYAKTHDAEPQGLHVVNYPEPTYIGTHNTKLLELIADDRGRPVTVRVREKGTDPDLTSR